MFGLVFTILLGFSIIMIFLFLFISDEQKRSNFSRNKFLKLSDHKGGIYLVNNLQMNVLNNITNNGMVQPVYNSHSLSGNYSRKKVSLVDSVIN